MPEFSVSSESVAGAGTAVRGLVTEFEGRLEACNRLVSGLSASWTGPASDAFSSGWSEFTNGALQVHDALSRISGLLDSTALQYAQTEAQVTTVSAESDVSSGILPGSRMGAF